MNCSFKTSCGTSKSRRYDLTWVSPPSSARCRAMPLTCYYRMICGEMNTISRSITPSFSQALVVQYSPLPHYWSVQQLFRYLEALPQMTCPRARQSIMVIGGHGFLGRRIVSALFENFPGPFAIVDVVCEALPAHRCTARCNGGSETRNSQLTWPAHERRMMTWGAGQLLLLRYCGLGVLR